MDNDQPERKVKTKQEKRMETLASSLYNIEAFFKEGFSEEEYEAFSVVMLDLSQKVERKKLTVGIKAKLNLLFNDAKYSTMSLEGLENLNNQLNATIQTYVKNVMN